MRQGRGRDTHSRCALMAVVGLLIAAAVPGAAMQDGRPPTRDAQADRPEQLTAGAAVELRGVEAGPDDEVRVIVQAGGSQVLLEATGEEEGGRSRWRFTPERTGTIIIATTSRGGPAANGLRVHRFDKLFVRVSSADGGAGARPSAAATARFGHRLELCPLVDPTILRAGSDLPLRVKIEGESLVSAQVRLACEPGGDMRDRIGIAGPGAADMAPRAAPAPPALSMQFETGDGGTIVVPIRSAGRWTITVEHDAPPDGAMGVRDRFVASMTFMVEDAASPALMAKPPRPEKRALGGAPLVWQSSGPAPIGGVEYTGRIAALAVGPTDADTIFVGGADGGIWRTIDGGASWVPLTDHMPTTAMGALAIDPTDEDIIYAGTGEANFAYHSRFGLGLYKSIDGGDTWAHLAESTFAGRCFSRIAIDPVNPSELYAAVTPAGGFIPAPASAAKGHPLAGGPVGVFKSIDGGANWTQLGGGLPALAATDVAIQPDDPQVIYAAIGHIFGSVANGIYKSINGGSTWAKLGGGLPVSDVGRISLAIAPSSTQRIYAAVTQASSSTGGSALLNGVFRSDNGGTTWASVSPGNYMATFGWYVNVIGVRPTDADTVFVGGVSLLRSTNAGGNWTAITPPHVDQHAIAWDAAGRMLAGDDGGLHLTTDLGNSWSALNEGLGLVQFYAGLSLDPATGEPAFGGTQDNGTNKRLGPDDWIHVLGGDGGYTAVNRENPDIVFAEFQGTGNLFRSINGGLNWNSSSSGITASDRNCFLPPFEFDPADDQRLVYGTHRVYESLNGGLSWSAISGDLTATPSGAIHSIAIAPSNPQTIWVTTNDGNVQVTFDGGAQWNLVRTNVPGWFRSMRQVFAAPDNHLRAYVAGSAFGTEQVLRTIDGGQTWQFLDGDLPDLPVNVLAADTRPATEVIYAGTEAGVYRSLDEGLSWHRLGTGMPNAAVIDLRLDLPRTRLIAATQGRGVWRIDLCPGDVNGDRGMDVTDLLSLLAAWGMCPALPDGCPADIDGDGMVGVHDLLTLLASWGACP